MRGSVTLEVPQLARIGLAAFAAFAPWALAACSGAGQVPQAQPSAGAPTVTSIPAAPSAAAGAPAVAGSQAPAMIMQLVAGMPAPAAPPQSVAGAGAAGMPAASVPLGGTGAGGAAAPVEPPPAASLKITIPNVAPGGEDTQCVQIRMVNTAPLNIIKLHNKLSLGSHHFILTALNDPMASDKPLARCQGFGASITGAPVTITQAHDDTVVLPEGIGYHLIAGQTMHLEMHYINTSDRALDITATSDLYAAPASAQLQEAAVLLVGTADISVPPHGTMETGPKFLALPAGMSDVKFYAITGHTHRFGTKVTVSSASAAMTPLAELYAPQHYDWEAPETKPLTPHLSLPANGGFLLDCAWNNTSDGTLKWGESALDEMCFFWGYYYPRKDVFSIVVDNIDQEVLKKVVSMPPAAPPMP